MQIRARPATKRPKVLEARPLTRDDLVHLQPGKPRARQGIVQRFRETHHRIARLLAAGYRNEQVADITGYSLPRIYTLCADPAFQELIAQYKGKVDAAFEAQVDDFAVASVQTMKDSEQMVAEHVRRAQESGELIPLPTLIRLIADRADRFGYGKHTTQTNVNVDLAGRLERMKLRSGKANVIDAKVIQSIAPDSRTTGHQSPAGTPPPGRSPQVSVPSVAQSVEQAVEYRTDYVGSSPTARANSRAAVGAQLKSLASSMVLRRA